MAPPQGVHQTGHHLPQGPLRRLPPTRSAHTIRLNVVAEAGACPLMPRTSMNTRGSRVRIPGRAFAQRGRVLGQNGRMDLGLRGRVYLVTGGSRGLGFAAAQALTGEGARVVLSAPHEATAAAAAARLTHNGTAADAVTWIVADNADPATPGLLIAAARDRFGRLDG